MKRSYYHCVMCIIAYAGLVLPSMAGNINSEFEISSPIQDEKILPQTIPTLNTNISYEYRPFIRSIGMFANDTFWDGKDRWRTGSYQRSVFINHDKYEFRFRNEFITPEDLSNPDVNNDRPYAAILNFGFFRHIEHENSTYSLGLSTDIINELESLENFHNWVHDRLDFNRLNLNNHKVPKTTKLNAEASYRYHYQANNNYFVPFIEAKAGTMDILTFGLDYVYSHKKPFFLTREQTTGNLLFEYGELNQRNPEWGFVLGADASYVWDDYYLENSKSNVTSEDWRYRARLGVFYQRYNSTFFIGPTYLSKEFNEQSEGQILQTFHVELRF